MRNCKITTAFLLVTLAPNISCQQQHRSVLLPAHEVKAVSRRYSREIGEDHRKLAANQGGPQWLGG
jgi:hypothetical protein